MPFREPLRMLFVPGTFDDTQPLQDYLQSACGVTLDVAPSAQLPAHLRDYQVVLVTEPDQLTEPDQDRLTAYVRRGGACLGLIAPTTRSLPPLFGARLGESGPTTEIRVRFNQPNSDFARRLPPSFYVTAQFQPLEPLDASAQPLLTTIWQYQQTPLALMRDEGDGRVGCFALRNVAAPIVPQLVYRCVRELARVEEPTPLGVAVLGYGPISYVHGSAAQAVPGLSFRAVCDLNAERLAQAQREFPDLRTYTDSRELANDPTVDLVVVATAPNIHAQLAIELLQAGKHVVCEKPLCITRDEAERMQATAAEQGRLLTSHQNRRWDADFLSIQQALRTGQIGTPFYLEAFVGSFFHPCDHWHSHAAISGGALYDWGAHYVDSILNLMPGPVTAVSSVAHKRVWHDVTNADQERVQLRFADGREAEFLYSEVAAVRKPKWYILGTEGAIVGHWQEVTMHDPDRLTYYREEQIPVTEIPPRLTLTWRHGDNQLAEQQVPLVQPQPYAYHRNLADHLLTGAPLEVTAAQATRVVTILEAAARSAQRGGATEEINV